MAFFSRFRMEFDKVFYTGHNNKTVIIMEETATDASNGPLNANISEHYDPPPYHPITSFIEQYAIPCICLLGLISNTLASIVFLQKPLRKSSCSIFLAVRGFSDNGFLSTLLIIWISRTFRLQLGTLNGSCNVIIFLSYVCGFISVWLVVLVTLENYIRICKPFVVNTFCTTLAANIVVAILFCIALCFYSFTFWAMSSENCVPFPKYHYTVQALIYVDSFITLIVPLFFIIYLMTAIVCDLIKSYSLRNRQRATTVKRTENPLAKVTKMLFAVTVTFFCFNLPSHVYRLLIMISSLLDKSSYQKTFSIQEEAIHQVTLLISYFSLSTNIIVYMIFGSKFRQVFFNMCRRSTKRRGPAIIVDMASGNGLSTNIYTTLNKSLSSVLLASSNHTPEMVPLRRTHSH